jgi:hypothetical protein
MKVYVVVGQNDHASSEVIEVHADRARATARVELARKQQRKAQDLAADAFGDMPDEEYERRREKAQAAMRRFVFGETNVHCDGFYVQEFRVIKPQRAGNRAAVKKAQPDGEASNG